MDLLNVVSILLLGITLPIQAHAKILTVGGTAGWTNFDSSKSGPPDYTTWSSAQSVLVGDVLVFNYAANFHDVYQFATKPDYDSCNFAPATALAPASAGSYSWTAPAAGVYYFGCSFGLEGSGSHCDVGQKLAVTVSPAATPTGAPILGPILAPTLVPLPVPVAGPILAPVPVILVPVPSPVVVQAPNAAVPAPAPPTGNVTAPAPAPANVTAPAPAPVNVTAPAPAPANVTAPAPAPVNGTTPAPAPSPVVIPTVPTPAPAATTPAPAPARRAPAPSPHRAPRPSPRHSPKHSPAPAPAPFLGPPAPPSPPTPPYFFPPTLSPTGPPGNAGCSVSPPGWRSVVVLGLSLAVALSAFF